MFVQCKDYLITRLKAAGVKSSIHTSRKTFEKSTESHLGAVLFDSEEYLRNGSKTIYKINGATRKRRKIFDRNLYFSVIIGDYSDDAAEAILEKFIPSLNDGFMLDGNFIAINVEGADWVDKDDSILKAKISVQVNIKFEGGVYKDTDFAELNELEIVSITKKGDI